MEPNINGHEPLVYLTFVRFEWSQVESTLTNSSLGSRNLFMRLRDVEGVKEIWYLQDEVYQQFEVDIFAVIEYAETTAMESVHEILQNQRRRPGALACAMKELFTIPMKEKDFEDRKRPHESIGERVVNMQLLDYTGLGQQAIDEVEARMQGFFESRLQAGFTFDRIEAKWSQPDGTKL
ncbi:hypothetical protein GX51_00675 [Blastomyces parvus]|uniref:Uncharacterized protein n=1 Tax=Blastomyces parvus TaxID=2060905 RepID=A0A2B7XKV4_9EURO|nr:hypothetical protein GX51_00675 [Blastomyces parvus]